MGTKFSYFFFNFWRNSPQWARASSFTRLLDHTQRRTAVGRTRLDEWPARRSDLYLTTLNNRQIFIPPLGFEPTISVGARPQTYALDRGQWERRWQVYFHEKVIKQFNTKKFSLPFFFFLCLTSFSYSLQVQRFVPVPHHTAPISSAASPCG